MNDDPYAYGWVDGYLQLLDDVAAEYDRIHTVVARVQLQLIIGTLRARVGARVAAGNMDEDLYTRGWVAGYNQGLVDLAAESDRLIDTSARQQLQRLVATLRYLNSTGIVR